MASNVVDANSATANMYGCEPCPKCGGIYRVPYNRPGGGVIECDDCGFKEPAVLHQFAWECPHDGPNICEDCAAREPDDGD